MKNLFIKLLNRIGSIFSNNKNKEIKSDSNIEKFETENEKEKNRQKIAYADSERRIAIENLQIDISQEKSTSELLTKIPIHVLIMSQVYKNYGYIHAKVNSRDYNIRSIATGEASTITEHIQSVVNGTVNGLKHQINTLEKKRKKIDEELTICQEHRKQILDYSNDNENQFSAWRAYMYIFFGLLLLFADIPLSLSVVSAYGIVGSLNGLPLLQKLKNIEAFLFAFGIAFSTILIKILYDEYINTRLGKWALELRKFNEEERPFVERERFIKLGVKLIILTGLLVMLFYSGVFREANFPSEEKEGRFISFMLLTIIIPTTSGICLSIGLNNLSNITTLSKSVKNLEKIQQQDDMISDELQKLVVKISQLEVFRNEWNNTEHKINKISEQLVASYNQGFKNGYLTEFGYDLYKQVQDYHSEKINKNFIDKNETL